MGYSVSETVNRKLLAAYAGLSGEKAVSYDEVKAAVLHRFDMNEETYERRFRSDHKKMEENWGSRLTDHFTQWTKDQPMPVEELMVLDQFLYGVPEDLRVRLKERSPGSLQQAMKLADSCLSLCERETRTAEGSHQQQLGRRRGCTLQLGVAMRLPGMQGVESICVVEPWKDGL